MGVVVLQVEAMLWISRCRGRPSLLPQPTVLACVSRSSSAAIRPSAIGASTATFFTSPRETSQHHNMAQVDRRKRSLEHEGDALPDPVTARKKLKTSDLPLTQNKRAAIEAILHTFKKKGEFDSLRKDAFNKFEQSVRRRAFLSSPCSR